MRARFRAASALVSFLALATAACGTRYCGGLRGKPPMGRAIIKEGDVTLEVLERGAYKGYYDTLGQLVRIEYDGNGDGRADAIARYERGRPRLLEIDEDYDGWVDRFEHYDEQGHLGRIGRARKGPGREAVWTVLGADKQPARVEYDESGDGKADRIEILEGVRVVRVEVDANRDGVMDRFLNFSGKQLMSEEIDTDGDGRPDRRLRYERGRVRGVEPITP